MSRLVHSQAAFIKSLKISTAQVFAFVEGRLDRSFFDRLLSMALQPSNLKHQVFAIAELPAGVGGKAALLRTFRYFRKHSLLRTTAFGKKMACVFFADKDSDDFCRKRLRSGHLIYSPTYDLEGYLYSCADLQRALADACGLTIDQARSLLPDPKAWLRQVTQTWRDWIALCLVSQRKATNCGCTFDRISQVNPNPLAPPDASQVTTFKTKLSQSLGVSFVEIDRLHRNALSRIDESLAQGQPLRYFKGKWFSHILECLLATKRKAKLMPADAKLSGVGEGLCSLLLAQVAQSQGCACSTPYLAGLATISAGL